MAQPEALDFGITRHSMALVRNQTKHFPDSNPGLDSPGSINYG